MRRALVIAALVIACGSSCTFPTVAYEEACEVPSPPCNIAKYSDDGNKLRDERDTCVDMCGGTPCKTQCFDTYDDDIALLRQECELCSASNGCTKASADCLKWIEP